MGRQSESRIGDELIPAGILTIGESAEYPSGTVFFHHGAPVRSVFLIETGIVKIERTDVRGTHVILGFRTPGWLLGAAAAVLDCRYAVTAESAGRSSVRRIDRADFERLRSDAPIREWLLRMYARELYDQVSVAAGFATRDARERLGALLLGLIRAGHERQPDGSLRLRLPLTQEEIGAAVRVSREYAGRLLGEFEQLGLIRRRKGWIVIPASSRLVAQANRPANSQDL